MSTCIVLACAFANGLIMFTIAMYAVLIAIVRDQYIFKIANYAVLIAILRGQFIILCIRNCDAHGPDRDFTVVGLCSRSRITRS